MFYDPRSQDHGLPHNPWMALVAPRPIAWVSTVSKSGVPNLAPFSSYNTLSASPPFLMFSANAEKDTVRNIRDTGVFVVNVSTGPLAEQMNASSADFAPDVDEFRIVGLDTAPCRSIDCVRVAAAPAAIECRLSEIVSLTPSTGASCSARVIIGEAVGIHIDESVLRDGRVDPALLKPLSRLGYMDYAVVDKTFEIMRPAKPGASPNPETETAR